MESFFSHLTTFEAVFPSSQIGANREVIEVIIGGKYYYDDKVFQRGTILWHIMDECIMNGTTDSEQPYSSLSFIFKVKGKKRIFPKISIWQEIHPCEIEEFFLEAQAMLENPDIDRNLMTVYLYSRLGRQTMNVDISEKQTTVRYGPTMRKILKMLTVTDKMTASLTEIAKVTNLSESYISHLFRKEMGITPHRYLQKQKIKAARVLLNGPLPIKTIAERCGFSRLRSFYAAFKRETGMSPGELRNKRVYVDFEKNKKYIVD
jgi:AraC-like DNA-binding protein